MKCIANQARHWAHALVIGTLAAIVIGPASAQCVGDCGDDGEVTVNELIIGVNIALGNAALDSCPVFDVDGSGDVTVNELIVAVNNALNSCPTPEPTPTDTPEEATATETPVPTDTPLPTDTPVGLPTETATILATDTPAPLPSNTPIPEATATDTPAVAPTATATPASSPTVTATASATATQAAAVCGNGIIEAGETCDDGNTITNPPTDTCPADCTIINCASAGTNRKVSVSFTPPGGASVSSLSVLLEYPDGTVKVQGTGSDDNVQASVTNTPGGVLVALFDYDYALRLDFAGTHAITPGKLFDLSVRDCKNATPPSAAAFNCRVISASAPDTSSVLGVTCGASLP